MTEANLRRVRQGGLMRCCLSTICESIADTQVGSVLSCKYESDPNNEQMIVAADGVWEWNHA
jgi:hypothetical protein